MDALPTVFKTFLLWLKDQPSPVSLITGVLAFVLVLMVVLFFLKRDTRVITFFGALVLVFSIILFILIFTSNQQESGTTSAVENESTDPISQVPDTPRRSDTRTDQTAPAVDYQNLSGTIMGQTHTGIAGVRIYQANQELGISDQGGGFSIRAPAEATAPSVTLRFEPQENCTPHTYTLPLSQRSGHAILLTCK